MIHKQSDIDRLVKSGDLVPFEIRNAPDDFKLADSEYLLKVRLGDDPEKNFEHYNKMAQKPKDPNVEMWKKYAADIRRDIDNDACTTYASTGFMTKLTKKGEFPVAFGKWNDHDKVNGKKAFIIKEKFQTGWRFDSFRRGQSQDWATLVHPLGFKVDVYGDVMEQIIKDYNILKGLIEGSFMWEPYKLIEKPI